MRAAILREYGAAPQVGDWEEPPADVEDGTVVEVLAAGLNPVDLSIASGSFYGGVPPLPYVVGREGVGRRPDGSRVYFDAPVAPFGSFAGRAPVLDRTMLPVPDDLDAGLAVALGIAGLAAWLALEWRAGLRAGETVLVLGASGVVGQIGVQAARLLGAERVVAAARDPQGLDRARQLGADATVRLDQAGADLTDALREAAGGGHDVVLDPLWGDPAAAALGAANPGARLVQVGQSAGADATIASADVRGRGLAILGHTNLSAPAEVKRAAYQRMATHAVAGELAVEVERVALERAADAWARQRQSPHHKLVVVP